MTPPPDSALDAVLKRASYLTVDNGAPGEPEFDAEQLAAAREELERLRDCAALLHAAEADEHLACIAPVWKRWFLYKDGRTLEMGPLHETDGLPVLTASQRARIRSENTNG